MNEIPNDRLVVEKLPPPFFEQHRWRYYGYEPDETGMQYIHALVEDIREEVQAGRID